MDDLEALRYPIGRYAILPDVTAEQRKASIDAVATAPVLLRKAVDGLGDAQLDRTYRPGSWTLRQVVHHVADEHMNAFAYFKMALTEDEPTIKPYVEPLWAETVDAVRAPVGPSIELLSGLHARWVILLRALEPCDFGRAYVHKRGRTTLDEALQIYAWHGRHHAAQITGLRERQGL